MNKILAILADDILKNIFGNENISISIQISLKFGSFVQLMVWRRTCDKPLLEAMMTQITELPDSYIRH